MGSVGAAGSNPGNVDPSATLKRIASALTDGNEIANPLFDEAAATPHGSPFKLRRAATPAVEGAEQLRRSYNQASTLFNELRSAQTGSDQQVNAALRESGAALRDVHIRSEVSDLSFVSRVTANGANGWWSNIFGMEHGTHVAWSNIDSLVDIGRDLTSVRATAAETILRAAQTLR